MKLKWIEIDGNLFIVNIKCKKCELVINPTKCIASVDKKLLYYKGGYGGGCIKGNVMEGIGNTTVPIALPQIQPPTACAQPYQLPYNPYVLPKDELLPIVYCPRCKEQVTFTECVPVDKSAALNSEYFKRE